MSGRAKAHCYSGPGAIRYRARKELRIVGRWPHGRWCRLSVQWLRGSIAVLRVLYHGTVCATVRTLMHVCGESLARVCPGGSLVQAVVTAWLVWELQVVFGCQRQCSDAVRHGWWVHAPMPWCERVDYALKICNVVLVHDAGALAHGSRAA